MISIELARALRDSGLEWKPRAGDAFLIDRIEADEEVFILSDMTVEAHEFSTGTVLGFNGTTEWALDSVAIDDALWRPHEHQLRELLGTAFRSLRAGGSAAAGSDVGSSAAVSTDAASTAARADAGFTVEAEIAGETVQFVADDAANAYARALLRMLDSAAL